MATTLQRIADEETPVNPSHLIVEDTTRARARTSPMSVRRRAKSSSACNACRTLARGDVGP
jgi:hypothetical protein